MPDASAVGPIGVLVVDVARNAPIELDGTVRESWIDGAGRVMVGFEFDPGQTAARARLARMLFEERAARLPESATPLPRRAAVRSLA